MDDQPFYHPDPEVHQRRVNEALGRATVIDESHYMKRTAKLPSHAAKLPIVWGTLLLATGFFLGLAVCSQAHANSFKPLTRAEPIVRMVLQEAANEPFAGQVAVAGTVLDRMADARWPATAKGVVYQPWQYTGMRLRLREYMPSQIEEARAAVEIAKSGTRPCGTVYWYHTPAVKPKWRKRFEFRCRIGNHLFYGDRHE